MFRVFALTFCLMLPLTGSGCAIVEVGMRNPVVGLETVAVAPFFNLSQERTVDGREFALDYYAELQKVPGFEVLPVGVTERAMLENGISLAGPGDAVRLAQVLDVDAVVVGAVTDYDPYNPRIGLKVAWYSPRQFLFLPNEDPTIPFFNRSADAPVKQPGRPKYGTARAQSPDDSDEWQTAGFEPSQSQSATIIEDGNWEPINTSEVPPATLLAQAESPQLLPFLPEGTSLLVPAGDVQFPTVPQPEAVATDYESFDQTSRKQTITINYEPTDQPSGLVPAPAAEEPAPVTEQAVEIVPTQAVARPPTDLDPSPIARPILTAEPRQADDRSDGNPFNRHLATPQQPADARRNVNAGPADEPKPGQFGMPPRVAASEPEFPVSQSVPPSVAPGNARSEGLAVPEPPKPAPLLKTPLFPVPPTQSNPVPMAMPPSTVPALIYDDHVVVAPNEFDSTEPLMAYVRLFDATDRRLIARLSDYLELTGQLRSGDLEAYMKRSEFFRKFTAHVMISEMLQLHGGEARRQLVLKPRKYR